MSTFDIIFDVFCLGGGTICLCIYLYREKKKGRHFLKDALAAGEQKKKSKS